MDFTTSREWRTAAKAAREERQENRRLILAYPDIAAKLCDPPLDYTQPDRWTGHIPPRYDAERIDGVTPLNTSPRRAALLELLEAAAERYDADHRRAA